MVSAALLHSGSKHESLEYRQQFLENSKIWQLSRENWFKISSQSDISMYAFKLITKKGMSNK